MSRCSHAVLDARIREHKWWIFREKHCENNRLIDAHIFVMSLFIRRRSHNILLGDFEERTVGQSKHTATQTKLIQPDMFARNNVNKSTKSVATKPCTRSCPGSTSHPQPHIRAAIELFTTMAVYLHSIHTHMAHTHYIITPFGIIPYFVEYNK